MDAPVVQAFFERIEESLRGFVGGADRRSEGYRVERAVVGCSLCASFRGHRGGQPNLGHLLRFRWTGGSGEFRTDRDLPLRHRTTLMIASFSGPSASQTGTSIEAKNDIRLVSAGVVHNLRLVTVRLTLAIRKTQ